MPPTYGGGEKKCGRCGTNVYHSEEKIAAGGAWHNGCFTCKDCKKALDSQTLAVHKADKEGQVGEIYCKGCHNKRFGPKGYGYGGGAGALTNTGK